MRPGTVPALAGLAIAAILALGVGACQGSFTATTPVSVVWSPPAGLAMNKNAPVMLYEVPQDIEVGKVAWIQKADTHGRAFIHLAIDSSQLHLISANVRVEIGPSTAVHLIPPAHPSPQRLGPGEVLMVSKIRISGAAG